MLRALGAQSIELSDAGDDPILEPAPGTMPLWQRVELRALFDPAADMAEIRLGLAAVLPPATIASMRFESLEDRDWAREWQRDAKPVFFGERLAV